VTDLTKTRPKPKSVRAIYLRAILVSLTNPKTLLFYGAFFPQFVAMDHDAGMQIAELSVTFLLAHVVENDGLAVFRANRPHVPNAVSDSGC
jgi:homoserine/homoserine lactone efflux protein